MPDFPNAAHHIVAGKAPSAEAARQILLEYGVDIDDAANGVFLPTINNPDASVGVCCSHKVVAVGFNTLLLRRRASGY